MKEITNRIIALLDSFTTKPGGLSGRKLSAAAALLTALYVSVKLLPEAARISAVYALLVFSAVCLGLVTIPELIKFLSLRGGGTTDTKTPEDDKKTTDS